MVYSTGVASSYSAQTLGTTPRKFDLAGIVPWDGQGHTPTES